MKTFAHLYIVLVIYFLLEQDLINSFENKGILVIPKVSLYFKSNIIIKLSTETSKAELKHSDKCCIFHQLSMTKVSHLSKGDKIFHAAFHSEIHMWNAMCTSSIFKTPLTRQSAKWYIDKMVQKKVDLKQLNASAVWDTSELFPNSYKKQSKSFYNNYLKLK